MASLDSYFSPLIGFFSYSRDDDTGSKGALSALRDAIQWELSAQLGRAPKNFKIWQDKAAIPVGTDWEQQIRLGISQSVFFIPIITPRVFRSPNCAFEFESFLARERELRRADLVFPILYIPVPELEDEIAWRKDPVLRVVGMRQYFDWRNLRLRDSTSSEVALNIEQFCRTIANALRQPWETPEERQQREIAEAKRIAEQEQARKKAEMEAARAAKQERKRREAEAARLAEEQERRRREADAARLAEEQERQRCEAEAARLAREQERRRREAEAARLAEEQERQRHEAEAARLAEEQERQRHETEAARLAEEQERQRREAEAARLAEEQERQRREAEAARLAEEKERQRREAEAARLAEKQERQRREAEAAAGQVLAAAARRRSVQKESRSAAVAREGGASDQMAARLLGIAQLPKWKPSRATMMTGGAIAAALLIGIVIVLEYTPSPSSQHAAVIPTPAPAKPVPSSQYAAVPPAPVPSKPTSAIHQASTVPAPLSPPAKSPVLSAVQPPPQSSPAITSVVAPPVQIPPVTQLPQTANAAPSTIPSITPSPVSPPASLASALVVPPKSLPSWASCNANPTQNADAPQGQGGDLQLTPIKVALTQAQKNAIAVRTIAFSPDGKTLVTAGDDTIIRVWDAATLKWIFGKTGHSAPVYSVAFSSDGNLLASASWDGTVQIWNARTFAHVHTFDTAPDGSGLTKVKQFGVAFKPGSNPQYVHSAGADGNVWVWDLRKQILANKLPSHTGNGDLRVGGLSFAPNGSGVFVTANFDGTIKFFDPGRNDTVPAYPGGTALRLAYSPDGIQLGTMVASAGSEPGNSVGLKLWNGATHALFKTISANHGHVSSVAWSHDGTRLATGGGYSDPSVSLWDVQSGKQVPQFSRNAADVDAKDFEHKDVEAVAFHPNHKWLVSASETGKMKIWDIATGDELLNVVGIPGGSEYVAYKRNGCYTGSANANDYVRYVTKEGDRGGTALLVPNDATDLLLPRE